MSKFEVKCTRPGCGQGLETTDVDKMMAWSDAHDEACPALKALQVAPAIIDDAERRGVVRELSKVIEYLNAKADTATPETADTLRTVAVNIAARIARTESGEVTL